MTKLEHVELSSIVLRGGFNAILDGYDCRSGQHLFKSQTRVGRHFTGHSARRGVNLCAVTLWVVTLWVVTLCAVTL